MSTMDIMGATDSTEIGLICFLLFMIIKSVFENAMNSKKCFKTD